MRNLSDSQFEYWEKIGYVGYNNYTDLHLKLKKNVFLKEFESTNRDRLSTYYNLPYLLSHHVYNEYFKTKENFEFQSNFFYFSNKKNLKIKKFKISLIFNTFINLLKKLYLLQFNFFKIYKFLKNWKKKKYNLIFKLLNFKKNLNYLYIKRIICFIYNIFNIYFKLLFFSLKKMILNIKKKLYRYLKYFNKFFFLRKRKHYLIKINKLLLKNIFLLYKNPFIIKKYQDVFNFYQENNLFDNIIIRNRYYQANDSLKKGIFKDIPSSHINEKKNRIRFFLFSCFNKKISELKLIYNQYKFSNWEKFFIFFENNLYNLKKKININDIYINNFYLNGIKYNYSYNNIFLKNGDFLEFNLNNIYVLSYVLNKKFILFYFFFFYLYKNNYFFIYFYKNYINVFFYYLKNNNDIISK